MASRLVRVNAVTVGDVLDRHTLLQIDCVDRVYLTLSVPGLVAGGQVVSFLTAHEKNPIPSPALLERRGAAFRRAVASFAEANDIPVLSFAGKRDKGRPGVLAESPWPERKIDKVMPLMRKAAATGRSQVVAIGVAQEYQRVFTGTKDQTPTGAVWFSYNRTERRVTCYYFYVWDEGFGPAFIKICAYFPYPGKIWLNGHEWAKRQAAREGLSFRELSNGFASCEDPAALQEICDRLGPGHIRVFAERWRARLPLPFTSADRQAGYWQDISMRQVEVAKTIAFTAPRHARAFFEALAAGNLDIGRPDNMEIIFNRQVRCVTKGVFRTAAGRDNDGVVLNAFCRHSRIKTCLKDGRALRVETVINDACDIGVLRRIEHFGELTARARDINGRLMQAMRAGQDCVLASPAIERAAARPYRGWQAGPGPAVRRAPGHGPGRCIVPDAVRRLRPDQQEPARLDRPAARSRLQRQPDDLRPAPPAPQRPDPPDRAHPHLCADPRRPAHCGLLHQAQRPTPQTPGRGRPATSPTRTTPGPGSHRSPRQ
jgi:hypothetical protein